MAPPIQVDGKFGGGTKTTLTIWQKDNGLPGTGIADQATWDKLCSVTSGAPLSDEEKADKQAKTAAGIASAGSAITGLISAFTPQEMLAQPVSDYDEPDDGLPWGWIIGGVVVVGLLGGAYLLMRD